jgi:hypothetical protein
MGIGLELERRRRQARREGGSVAGLPHTLVEIDKTDPLDKLQHKMNLVSNYFIK